MHSEGRTRGVLFAMTRKTWHIKSAHFQTGGEDRVTDARVRYKEQFPGRKARRMTHLGILVDLCLRNIEITDTTALIYASAFAESSSLEDFIDSFPHASPMGFQTSIHPSAVEQSLIMRGRPAQRFYPVTSSQNLAGQALENALLLGDERVVLVGGEERGGWLVPHELASDRSFAFALELESTAEGSIGAVSLREGEMLGSVPNVELPALFESISKKQALEVVSYALGSWIRIDWK